MIEWDPAAGRQGVFRPERADQGQDQSDIFKLTLNVDQDLSGGYSLTSITGFKTYDFHYLEDYDATGVYTNNYQQKQNVDYISQEFRLNSPQSGPVIWFAGISAYSEKIDATFGNQYSEDQLCRSLGVTEEIGPVTGCADPLFEDFWGSPIDPAAILPSKTEVNSNTGDYWGWAAYADVTWSVTDRLDLIVGARYTWDHKKFTTNVFDSGGALGNNFVWGLFTDGEISDSKD